MKGAIVYGGRVIFAGLMCWIVYTKISPVVRDTVKSVSLLLGG